MRKDNELRWLLIDLDGTLAYSEPPDYELQEPIEGAREAMEKLTSKGWKIIIYTARPWIDYEIIENWLNKYQIPFRRIICGKPLGKYIVDDRNLEFHGDWEETMRKIV